MEDMRTRSLHFQGRTYAAFLFDTDGTMLDALAVVERVRHECAASHGIDAAEPVALADVITRSVNRQPALTTPDRGSHGRRCAVELAASILIDPRGIATTPIEGLASRFQHVIGSPDAIPAIAALVPPLVRRAAKLSCVRLTERLP